MKRPAFPVVPGVDGALPDDPREIIKIAAPSAIRSSSRRRAAAAAAACAWCRPRRR